MHEDIDPQTAGMAALQVHQRAPCLGLLSCWSSRLSVLLYACCLQGSISRGGGGGGGGLESHAPITFDCSASATACILPAGKTTLLDVLAGRRSGQGVTGRIHINGNRVNSHQLRDSVG